MDNMTKIIFKFDDFRGITKQVRFVDRCSRLLNIKVTWGIIGSAVCSWDDDAVKWIKNAVQSGLYCFWNHGWTHEFREFASLSEKEIVTRLVNTQNAVHEKLGIVMDTVGAPCNAFNEDFANALNSVQELRYWYYGLDCWGGRNFKRELELEYPLFRPSFLGCPNNRLDAGNVDESIKTISAALDNPAAFMPPASKLSDLCSRISGMFDEIVDSFLASR